MELNVFAPKSYKGKEKFVFVIFSSPQGSDSNHKFVGNEDKYVEQYDEEHNADA